jgi:DinB family protein
MTLTAEERDHRIEQYASAPLRLRQALADVPAEAMKWRPEPGEFSVHEIVCHCADSETNAYSRIRYLLTAQEPVIVGYDPDVWAREFDYASHPRDAALATIEAVRGNTAPILRRLPEEAWAKEGTHTESGRYTAADWLRIYSEHLEEHIGQIERTVEAWRAR